MIREEEWRDFDSYGWVGGGGWRVEGGARHESFTVQTCPLPYKFQRPARLRNHFVPVIHH